MNDLTSFAITLIICGALLYALATMMKVSIEMTLMQSVPAAARSAKSWMVTALIMVTGPAVILATGALLS